MPLPTVDTSANQVPLYTVARFGPNLPTINNGLQWRIYADKPDQTGVFRLVKEDKNAAKAPPPAPAKPAAALSSQAPTA